jgi:hypothetical protein
MPYIALFVAGVFLCNSLPHLIAGLLGMPFPTPFAEPRGKGNSPPVVNFLWGAFNMIVGGGLLIHYPETMGLNAEFAATVSGALATGTLMSYHFGRVRKLPRRQP